MARNTCTFTVKTPKTTFRKSKSADAMKLFREEIEKNAVAHVVNNIGTWVKTQKNRDLTTVATFFQRVCARTPLDERYDTGNIDSFGRPIIHEPDEDQCRYDWYVQRGSKKILAREIYEAYPDVFDTVNDKKSIQAIATYLNFEFDIYNNDEYVIGNENKHFATLEYGGYTTIESEVKEGEKYEHGIKNQRSVQAPYGMLRITQMELESIKNKVAKTPDTERFKRQKVNKVPNEQVLKRLVSKLKTNGKIELSDIKEYLK